VGDLVVVSMVDWVLSVGGVLGRGEGCYWLRSGIGVGDTDT